MSLCDQSDIDSFGRVSFVQWQTNSCCANFYTSEIDTRCPSLERTVPLFDRSNMDSTAVRVALVWWHSLSV